MKLSRYKFRKAGLIFLAVSAALAVGANVSRLSIPKSKLAKIHQEEIVLAKNRELPEQLKKLESEKKALTEQAEAYDKEREDMQKEIAGFQKDSAELEEARARMRALLEENASFREIPMRFFYGIYDQKFTETEEKDGAIADQILSLIPGGAGFIAKTAIEMSGYEEQKNKVYDLQSARNEVFRSMLYEPSREAATALYAYNGELDFYEYLLEDVEDTEERIKREMLIDSLSARLAVKEEWDEKKETLIKKLARLEYLTELCVEVYDGTTMDSDEKEYFMNHMLGQQYGIENALDSQIAPLTYGDYFTEEERVEVLKQALDSYQELAGALAADYWYGAGVMSSGMWVNGARKQEILSWARMERGANRDMFYVSEEMGSTHYYDTSGQPFKIISPNGTIYLYKGECISTDMDERHTEAEIEASRWLHDEGGTMDKYTFQRSYYEHTARAILGE